VELKQIKELMSSMKREGITKLIIKEKAGYELHLERQEEGGAPVSAPIAHPHYIPHPHPLHPPIKDEFHRFPHAPVAAHAEEKEPEKKEEKPGGQFVTSPMVGTYYASPSPDDPVFVKVGDRVDENTVVCIIEAMKVMNEVKAGVSGVIAEIHIDNAHPVEFGTKIMRIV
jgi:acetyl-CoA carboxylase biotin carboxyl carrier protein